MKTSFERFMSVVFLSFVIQWLSIFKVALELLKIVHVFLTFI